MTGTSNQIRVELRPYECLESRRGKLRKTTRPQMWVWIDEGDGEFQRVGLVYDKPGSRFCATIQLSDLTAEELAAIDDAIAARHGKQPPRAAGMPKPIDEDDGVDEDDGSGDDVTSPDY